MDTSKENILIIFGDAGINYYGGKQDRDLKRQLAKLPLTLFPYPATTNSLRRLFIPITLCPGMKEKYIVYIKVSK